MYKGRSREDTKPHIFSMADLAFRNLVEEGENQSVLITGESGAGKTENTKKVIQYLASVATLDSPRARSGARHLSNLSQQILRANPILEAFGNAQTVRNNNSSRFGKFIRIKFMRSGQIAGAYIDWYLLEKSRVVKINSAERNYHVFYQLLSGADQSMKSRLQLQGLDVPDFNYTRRGNDVISGVSDRNEWDSLVEAFHIMGFSEKEQFSIMQTVAAVLHLGNIAVARESVRADQAALEPGSQTHVDKACRLLGIPADAFVKGLLHPVVRAGREIVEKVQTPEQVRSAIDALAKGIYERGFGDLVSRINRQLDRSAMGSDDSHFIGVLDIAGFEIFEDNSFEQLCINYTNEKLQQFFNHHMFVLEQEEYAREQIEWKFIDFGKDLQPTIDLIELPNPIGIFSCLDEDSVMPKATDLSFTDKLHGLWDRKTPKYRPSRLSQGFILTHYAAEVEYSTVGWLDKNKDPLNDNITRLLSSSSNHHVSSLFADCAETDDESRSNRSRVKKGLFRTVAQRHKEQLGSLMAQLHSTHPHFVRCILPNHKKRPKQFSTPLVLDQLRCNGVLEGIRIARTGFPNRLPFSEFRQRYEVLCRNMPKGYLEGQAATITILEKLNLDKSVYRVGLTKVFFRAGVLAELEEQRDALIRDIMSRFQSVTRGFVQRRIAHKKLYRAEAARLVQDNLRIYLQMQNSPWWRLFVRMRPLLGATHSANEVKKRDEAIQRLQAKMQQEEADRQKLEEERRRTEAEAQKIRQTLESERALALDKEEIFNRLKLRETELNDKLAGAIEDQESLEDQLDSLMEAKQKLEHQAESWHSELEQAGGIIARLEKEKTDLSAQIADLSFQLDNLERVRSEDAERDDAFANDKKVLESQLHLQQRKVVDLEAKLLKTDQDLEVKLATTTKDLQASRKQARDLSSENSEIRQQLAQLSVTSTGYEDIVRRKDSELAVLKRDQNKHESEWKALESERNNLSLRHDSLQTRLRQAQAEVDAMKSQTATLKREAVDAKQLLEAKLSENQKVADNRRMLEHQIDDLKDQLFKAQEELSRERQSRDDVQMLGQHRYTTLKEKYDNLNDSKITIEKEMYVQQDTLRRATESRNTAENSRKELQAELKKLRERFTQTEAMRIEAEAAAERTVSRQAQERTIAIRRELDELGLELDHTRDEKDRMSSEVQRLTALISDSDNFRSQNDQHKERLEREIVTIKGRLAASENDNRALLNKIQQKNLDIARSNSRAGDNQRSRLVQVQNEKSKLEEENKKLRRQLGDTQVTVTSLEKQKEKMAMEMDDLTHEVAREQKSSRNAEKASSTVSLQLSETNRTLESEKQLKSQAQANTRKTQANLDDAHKEIEQCRGQLLLLQKVFDPSLQDKSVSWESIQPRLSSTVDLAKELETAQADAKIAREKCARYEDQVRSLRRSHEAEMADMMNRHSNSKRNLLEEIDQNTLPGPRSPPHTRKGSNFKPISAISTPERRPASRSLQDSNQSDRTVDTTNYKHRVDMAAELEIVQNKLQISEMQNRHLQSQLGRSTPSDLWQEDSPSLRRVHKLEKENSRLHEKLDDSARKVSTLERSIRSGELSLRDVQAKSHEELFDLLNSQEDNRRSLLKAHDMTVAELAEAKTQFDALKHSRANVEVDLRDTKSELQELSSAHENEVASRSQLLQDYTDLQIRLDAETSNLDDVTSSLNLYRNRADEYFSKLEQAEIAVLRASRGEQFAKAQARETEESCATIMAERKQMDAALDDLQRKTQQQDERIEDLSADLDGAMQAKKRLQHELEDYRSRREMDVEDNELSLDQMRKKYQHEFSGLANELEIERENVIHARSENSRLRDEIEELRSKWDDEVLNSSTWAKEKARLEMTQQDLSSSREEAVNALNESQTRIVSMLSQVRELRTSTDELSAERDVILKEKKSLELRLKNASEKFDELSRSDSPSLRNAAGMDREMLELRSQVAQKSDVADAAIEKMKRAEALATEMQKDLVAERDTIVGLHREKAGLEKGVRELQGRVVELEAKGFSSASHDVRFLNGRIQEVSPIMLVRFLAMADCFASLNNNSRSISPSSPTRRAPPGTSTGPCGTCRARWSGATSRTRSCRTRSGRSATRSSDCWRPSTSCRLMSRATSWPRDGPSVTCARSARSGCGWSASSRAGRACGWSGTCWAAAAQLRAPAGQLTAGARASRIARG